MVIPPEIFRFISEHGNENPAKLRLKYHSSAEPWIELAINHIESTQRCGSKFGPMHPELMALPLSVEQATSAPVAKLHASIVAQLLPGATSMLDMTCGMGIDLAAIIEELGEECSALTFDLNPLIAEVAAYNFRNRPNVEVRHGDSVEWLRESDQKYNLIFIDPARRDTAGRRLFNIHDCGPDVAELMPLLGMKCDVAMVKLSPMLDVVQTLRDLPCSSLFVVDEGGECRELLVLVDFRRPLFEAAEVPIHVCSLPLATRFSFTISEERQAAAAELPGEMHCGQWLFEPSPAMMKAGAFNLLSARFGLMKLHRNTHLYVAEKPIDGLLGKWREIVEVVDFSSSGAKAFVRRRMAADVAVRNFPLTADALTKKLRVATGGSHRILGVTTGNQNRKLIILNK